MFNSGSFVNVVVVDDIYLQLVLVVDAQELDVKDEGAVGGDGRAHGAGTVAHVGGDGQDALLAHTHLGESLVPALDDLADTYVVLLVLCGRFVLVRKEEKYLKRVTILAFFFLLSRVSLPRVKSKERPRSRLESNLAPVLWRVPV